MSALIASNAPKGEFDESLGGTMRREDIMKADLLSEIVLISSGLAVLLSLLMVLVVALTGVSPN